MNKSKAMKTDIDDKSNTSITNLDLSLLRRPIATSVTGFEEALRAYNDGTNEVRKVILLLGLKFLSLFYLIAKKTTI